MTKSATLRQLLFEGPMTVEEATAETGWPGRQTQIAVWVLTHTHQAKPIGSVPVIEHKRGAKTRKLYELTAHGRFLKRRDDKEKAAC